MRVGQLIGALLGHTQPAAVVGYNHSFDAPLSYLSDPARGGAGGITI